MTVRADSNLSRSVFGRRQQCMAKSVLGRRIVRATIFASAFAVPPHRHDQVFGGDVQDASAYETTDASKAHSLARLKYIHTGETLGPPDQPSRPGSAAECRTTLDRHLSGR